MIKLIKDEEVIFLDNDNTMVFKIDELENYMITEVLSHVNNSLTEKGYDGISQIVGYLMSGDLGFISNYKSCRNKLSKIDREKILEALLKNYLKDVK